MRVPNRVNARVRLGSVAEIRAPRASCPLACPKPRVRSRTTRWVARACNGTVQFFSADFRRQIDGHFPRHVPHKPDRQFESISVRQQVSDQPHTSRSGRRVARIDARCPRVSALGKLRGEGEALLQSSFGAVLSHFLRRALAKSGFIPPFSEHFMHAQQAAEGDDDLLIDSLQSATAFPAKEPSAMRAWEIRTCALIDATKCQGAQPLWDRRRELTRPEWRAIVPARPRSAAPQHVRSRRESSSGRTRASTSASCHKRSKE